MSTIQVVLDEELLRAADRAAERTGGNRSALVRDALREHLRRLRVHELEERDSAGYRKLPDTNDDLTVWEKVAAWQEELSAATSGSTVSLPRTKSGRSSSSPAAPPSAT